MPRNSYGLIRRTLTCTHFVIFQAYDGHKTHLKTNLMTVSVNWRSEC